LTIDEITRLAAFKNLKEFDFIQSFMRLTPDRRGLALMYKPDGTCIFLDGFDCSVQPVKPQQCRDFPNLWSFSGAEKSCRAVSQTVSSAKLIELVAEATGRPPDAVAEILEQQNKT
jgi:Fe-S-cluster containining protein